MKLILIATSLFINTISYSQTKGFEFLASSKSSLESVIKTYANSITDTSETYKIYYIPLLKYYNKAKASYNGYRGAMKDCILSNESKKKIQRCLKSKSVNIQEQLDSLDNILNNAYLDAYSKKALKADVPTYSGKNTGLFTGDFIKTLLDSLLDGTIKLWDQSKKYRREYKDNYLSNISSKEYDLVDIEVLLSKKVITPLAK